MEFNLQQYLELMHKDHREDLAKVFGAIEKTESTVSTKIDKVETKVDTVATTLHNHNTRLVVVENSRRLLIWAAGALTMAGLAAIGDVIVNHWRHP